MYNRLREELANAYSKPSWNASHIDRITRELAAIERLMAARRFTDLQVRRHA